MDRCSECGATGRLNAQGVCEWRAGCEHRQMVSEAIVARLDASLLSGNPTQVIMFSVGDPDAELLAAAYRHAIERHDPAVCLHCVADTN